VCATTIDRTKGWVPSVSTPRVVSRADFDEIAGPLWCKCPTKVYPRVHLEVPMKLWLIVHTAVRTLRIAVRPISESLSLSCAFQTRKWLGNPFDTPNQTTSSAQRLEFWRRSRLLRPTLGTRFILSAPMHGQYLRRGAPLRYSSSTKRAGTYANSPRAVRIRLWAWRPGGQRRQHLGCRQGTDMAISQ